MTDNSDLKIPAAPPLEKILKDRFGFDCFRPYQKEVCRSVVEGNDCLLVMPTGSGKSLCYQLPGMARQGTTLVISPLIALMEDQVAKMQAQGFRAERIHAGRERDASRQVCYDYLQGKLDFLYIAPERMSVPKFPEMLAKNKPSLIAIDEAHCISHWGHDFRPDYRRLVNHLKLLRPTPIIAVTATATEMVQDDIVTQLGLEKAKRFIHGFRRTNIAIEVVEIGVSERDALATSILKGKDRLPAIVYSPTRKHCESFAAHLKTELKAEAYHAGLPPLERDRIQSAFIKGELDAVVATIAFGMGIDKSNVRTVIHMALPSSLEAYYQEIGRAGRDGKPSRAILLHSYSDRRTHEYFHEQDYPEASILKKIFDSTKDTASPLGSIQQQVKIDADVFAKAIEKLWTHGGVTIDYQENVVRGTADWQKKYLIQREHKLAQLNLMEAFVKTRSCRMVHVIQHFGDKTDKELQCQMCDQCDSSHCLAQKFRVTTEIEDDALLKMYEALSERNGLSLGKLYTAHQQTSALARDTFESLVDGLAREGWVELRTDSFVKDNKTIRFQRVFLTQRARTASSFNLEGSVVPMRAISSSSTKTKKQKREKKETELKKSLGPLDGAALETFQQLRDWRTAEAKKRKVPPFMILTDRVLRAIAVNRPKDENELLEISGFGPKLYEKHGASMLQIIGGSGLD